MLEKNQQLLKNALKENNLAINLTMKEIEPE